jgi:iron(III) transport system ATP-binding protein
MSLILENLQKTFSHRGLEIQAVHHCNLEVNSGSLTVILGPSGCGKSTLLRLIAGLEIPTQGRIILNGEDLTQTPPEKRQIGMVFQEDSLFPSMTLEQQLRWALPKNSSTVRQELVNQLLEMGGMAHLKNRYPHQLSGGERQRGAILRSLAAQPRLLLLDEPFSRLDAPLRDSLRRDIRSLLKATGTTAILVTHDQEEALSLADQLVVMKAGTFVQTGSPQELYARPVNSFVARFLGRANIFSGQADGTKAQTDFGQIPLNTSAQGRVTLMIRPEHIELRPGTEFLIKEKEFRGHDVSWRLEHHQTEILVHTDWEEDFTPGQRVNIHFRLPAVVLNEPSNQNS